MARQPLSHRGYFLTLKTGEGYVNLVLNGNYLMITFTDGDWRNNHLAKGDIYRLSDESRKAIHDGQGWSLHYLLWLIDHFD